MAISYVGLPDYWLTSEEEGRPFFDLPTISQTWKMRGDRVGAFKSAFPVGAAFAGGYIVDRRLRDQGMLPEATLSIALAPNFSAVQEENSVSIQVFQKSAGVTSSDVIPGATAVRVRRKVSARVTQTTWRYFAGGLPGGARFSTVASGANPWILSDTVIAAASAPEDAPKGEVYLGSWAGSPTAVRDALRFNIRSYAESHSASRIPGTPWFSCQDVCVRGFDTGEDAS